MTTPQRSAALLLPAAVLLAFSACGVVEGPMWPFRQSAPAEKAQPAVADADLTVRVKSALASAPRVRANFIDVTTSNGVVRLSGFTDTQSDAEEAVAIAGSIAGVRRVQNDIVVRVSRDGGRDRR